MLSATFHAAVIGMAMIFAIGTCQRDKTPSPVLELVAGEGDNYGATEAPKLGVENGSKLDMSASLPAPMPEPAVIPLAPEPAPEPAKPEPPAPTPTPPEPKKETPKEAPKPAPKQPTMSKKLLTQVYNAKAKAMKEAAKERAAEEKRLAQMSKEEFDKRNKAAAARGPASSAKGPRIDAEGIRSGVVGGSSANKTGGAGGKALTAAQAELIDQYFAMLKQRVLRALDKPPGVSDNLSVTIVGYLSATGKLSNIRVVQSSGSEEFDHAAVAAFSRVTMPERPDHKGEEFELILKTKDVDQN